MCPLSQSPSRALRAPRAQDETPAATRPVRDPPGPTAGAGRRAEREGRKDAAQPRRGFRDLPGTKENSEGGGAGQGAAKERALQPLVPSNPPAGQTCARTRPLTTSTRPSHTSPVLYMGTLRLRDPTPPLTAPQSSLQVAGRDTAREDSGHVAVHGPQSPTATEALVQPSSGQAHGHGVNPPDTGLQRSREARVPGAPLPGALTCQGL